MAKLDILQEQYKGMRPSTIEGFYNGDFSSTKKYAGAMLNLWKTKDTFKQAYTMQHLIETIKKFDELLPYIKNKDIYSKEYEHVKAIIKVINEAQDKKNEKEFVREQHADVILETDNLLMLRPLTHLASVKYGKGTKWCTAIKDDDTHFDQYKENFLVYVINKKGDKGKNFNKLGIFLDDNTDPLIGTISVYIENDDTAYEVNLLKGKWTKEELYTIFSRYRLYCINIQEVENHRVVIETATKTMKDFDLSELSKSIEYLSNKKYDFSNQQIEMNAFIEKLKLLV